MTINKQALDADRHFDALASVRRLIRTGNNKSYWRQRERDILAARAALTPTDSGKD